MPPKRKSITKQPSLSFDEPPSKKAKRDALGDVTAKYTTQELQSFDKADIVAHVLALQDHVTKLSQSNPTEKKVDTLTPAQIDSKVDVSRRMLIGGLKSQMKVTFLQIFAIPNSSFYIYFVLCDSG
jgi:hypothetical protein